MKIKGKLENIWPDRTQYKPYAYNLKFSDVYVELNVPDESVTTETKQIKQEDGTTTTEDIKVLSLDGFTCVLGSVADAIDEMHKEATMSSQKKNKEKYEDLFRKGE